MTQAVNTVSAPTGAPECHRNRIRTALWCAVVLFAGFAWVGISGEAPEEGGRHTISHLGDLHGKRLGIIAGTMLGSAATGVLRDVRIVPYPDTASLLADLHCGKIDAIIDDQPVVRFHAAQDSRLRALPGVLLEERFAFAVRPGDKSLQEALDEELRQLLEDGTIRVLARGWLEKPDSAVERRVGRAAGGTGRPLRFGVSTVTPPLSFSGPDGETVGLDVDIMRLVAEKMGRELVVVTMDFGSLMAALADGRVDVIGSGITITRDREKFLRFTESYFHSGVSALVSTGATDGG